MVTTFPITQVRKLLHQAGKACPPGRMSPGWSKSTADVMKLLTPFTALRLKPGYVLRAYQFSDGLGSNGYIWAMPEDAPFPEPQECPTVEGWLNPHKPPAALDNLMDAIEGDGTPWSYLSVSMFSREANEFGAGWHGLRWSTHTVIGDDPWKRKKPSDRRPSATAADWNWKEPMPTQWKPTCEVTDSGVVVRFLTLCCQVEAIHRFTDLFVPGSYRFDTKDEVVAEGLEAIVF